MKRPLSLAILGVMWLLLGVVCLAAEAKNGNGIQIPSFNLLNILVGIGLLKCVRLARWYVLLVSGFQFVLGLVFFPWTLLNTSEVVYKFPMTLAHDQRPHEPVSILVLICVWTIVLSVSGWSFWVLSRRDVRDLFNPHTRTSRFVPAV